MDALAPGENIERRFVPLQPCPNGQHYRMPKAVAKRYNGWKLGNVLMGPDESVWAFVFRPKEVA